MLSMSILRILKRCISEEGYRRPSGTRASPVTRASIKVWTQAIPGARLWPWKKASRSPSWRSGANGPRRFDQPGRGCLALLPKDVDWIEATEEPT